MTDFDTRFQEADRRFKFMWRLVMTIIVVAFIGVIVSFSLLAYVGFKSADSVDKHGLRGTIERIWCGDDKDCKLPEVTRGH